MKISLLIFLLLSATNTLAADKAVSNRLINESSPYLLQHAYNPVDWYPWGEEAFNKARKENKPLFISIGYSTCHWCHVMAHESFENKEIAGILNKNFVSIKVDREERPDIDRIYITATEILAGSAGWPTTVIANNDLKPFFANTYIPPFAKDGHKGLKEILNSVITLWKEDRKRVEKVAEEVTEILRNHLKSKSEKGKVEIASLHQTYQNFKDGYDSEHGGFGNAPKFPRTSIFDFLMQYGKQYQANNAHDMTFNTLDHMIRGGIYDQVGGGFHRYSVDAQWNVPHFEKMLYDQGLIINSLLDANAIKPSKQFQQTITQSLHFVIDQMKNQQGGFYSAYDADSSRPDNPEEHGEGAYYVWKKSELDKILDNDEKKLFYLYFNIQKNGNVASDPQNEFANLNILHAEYPLLDTASELSIPLSHANKILKTSFSKLLKQRIKRPLPHLDDKIITSWNALIIKALAKAATQFNKPVYKEVAEETAHFIYRNLYNPKTKQLYRSYRKGKRSGDAYLDDYAYLTNALISLYKNTDNKQWLLWASDLMQQQIKLFYDTENSGFFDNTAKDKNILIRSKEIYDGALPSANAISAENLIELSKQMNKKEWKQMANKSIHSFHASMNELYDNFPQMFKSLMLMNQ